MTGWYVALALYLLGWIGTANAVVEHTERTPKAGVVLLMAFWPGWILGWCMVRGWKRDAWR